MPQFYFHLNKNAKIVCFSPYLRIVLEFLFHLVISICADIILGSVLAVVAATDVRKIASNADARARVVVLVDRARRELCIPLTIRKLSRRLTSRWHSAAVHTA